MIIDSHSHIFPDAVAKKAAHNIGDFYGLGIAFEDASADNLLKEGKKASIDKFVVHAPATNKHQVKDINDFIEKEVKLHPEFIGYMTLHPDMTEEDIAAAIDDGIKRGFKGIKLHPDFQMFKADCNEAQKIYRQAEGKMPILFHTGDLRYDYSHPLRITRVAKLFPHLKVIAAHFGGYNLCGDVECYKHIPNLYFDTSSSLMFVDKEKAVQVIRAFGAQRFFFGVDFPVWSPTEEVARFMDLPLTADEQKLILADNYIREFNLKI